MLYGTAGTLRSSAPSDFDDLILLGGLVVRHDDDAPVAAGIADVREADACVARGSLHDRTAGLERSASLRIEHDPFGGTVLDRPPGIHEFGLAEDLAACLLARGLSRISGVCAHRAR